MTSSPYFGQVGVTSRSFSSNVALRTELAAMCPKVKFNETGRSLTADELVEYLQGCERAIVALEKVDADLLDQLPDLRVISKYGVGLDNLDLQACSERGVRVGWTSGVNRQSVAELTVALIIMSLRELVDANREILAGRFIQRKGKQLSGRTVGLIGCGHVGKTLVPLLQAFGVQVLAYDIQDFSAYYQQAGVHGVGLKELLQKADVVSLHVPLTPMTRNILDAETLALMRPGAVLINTARGGLVDETALKEALKSDLLAAAAFDVFLPEPPEDKELLSLPNFVATPHVGGSAEEAILAMGRAAIQGLISPKPALDHLPPYLQENRISR